MATGGRPNDDPNESPSYQNSMPPAAERWTLGQDICPVYPCAPVTRNAYPCLPHPPGKALEIALGTPLATMSMLYDHPSAEDRRSRVFGHSALMCAVTLSMAM